MSAAAGGREPAGQARAGAAGEPADLPAWVRDQLRCPVTGAQLVDGRGPDGAPELHSTDPVRPLAYPVRGGVPVLLAGEARELAPAPSSS